MVRTDMSLSLCEICCFLIFWRAVSTFFIPEGLKKKAEIQPLSSLVFIGESLKLSCKLKDNTVGVAPENMYFEITPHHTNMPWRVPVENTTVINRTIYADVEIREDSFSRNTTVSCMAETQLHSAFIYVERPIQNITNFTGIYYYNKHIDLTWSLGVTYLDNSSIITKVDWNPNSAPNEQGNTCTSLTLDSCTIFPSGQDIIYVRIEVTYNLTNHQRPGAEFLKPLYATSAISVHEFRVDDYKKTMPPADLRFVNVTSTCVTITWDHPLYFASCDCNVMYQLIITEKDNLTATHTHTGVRGVLEENVTHCSLRPFTEYNLNLQIKAMEINPWSDPASIEIETAEDRPLIGPPMTDTSYHTGDFVGTKREVILYWKDPATQYLQGELTAFKVSVDNVTIPLRKGSNFFKTDLDWGSDHDVLVYSVTKVGSSLAPSEVVIPKKIDELPLLNDVTVRMEEETQKSVNVTVRWEPGIVRGRNVTLLFYLCQEAHVPYTCFNDFTVEEVSVDNKELVLINLPSTTNLYGYALRDDQGHKRGIHWINCLYSAKNTPDKPSSVNVNAGNLANSLIISWTLSRCDRLTKVLILRYHLFICTHKNESLHFCSYAAIDSTESTYVAKDLKEDSMYYAKLQAESPAGRGKMSDPVNGTTKLSGITDQNLTSGSIIGIAMGALVGVLFLGSASFCLFRQCKYSRKQVKNLAAATHQIWDKRQLIEDSGINTARNLTSSNSERLVAAPHLPSRSLDCVSKAEAANHNIPVECTHPEVTKSINNKEIDNTKVLISDNPSLRSTDEQVPPDTAEDFSDSRNVNMNGSKNVVSNSDNIIPYVMIANTGFSLVSGASDKVAVDEGYNSPETLIDGPSFLENIPEPHTFLSGTDMSVASLQSQKVFMESKLSPISAQSQNVLMESKLSPISPQSQNVLMESKLSPISPQSQNVFMEYKLSPISPQSQNVLMESKLSPISPQSQNVLMESKLSPISPQSQNVLMESKLSPISPQSQNVLMDSKLPLTSSILSPCPLLHVYNIKDASNLALQPKHPHLQSFTANIPTKNDRLKFSAQAGTDASNPEVYKIKSNSITYNVQESTSEESSGMSELLENNSDTLKDCSSYQLQSPGYVTCTVDGEINFVKPETSSECGSVSSQNTFSSYTSKDHSVPDNCLTSSLMEAKESGEGNNDAYKTLQFIEGSQKVDLCSHVGFETDFNNILSCQSNHLVHFNCHGDESVHFSCHGGDFNNQTTDYIRQALIDCNTTRLSSSTCI